MRKAVIKKKEESKEEMRHQKYVVRSAGTERPLKQSREFYRNSAYKEKKLYKAYSTKLFFAYSF